MHPNTGRMDPETALSCVRRSIISTVLFCIIYSTGMIHECISAKRTNNLYLYPAFFCIAAFFAMWGVTAAFMIPKDPMWYRKHEAYILIASILICFGPCLLIVAIYPIYGMWGCAIVFLWVCLIGNVNGAVSYLQECMRKKKLT
jgi:archaellum biogenesis protein FlaJ (TadC family)